MLEHKHRNPLENPQTLTVLSLNIQSWHSNNNSAEVIALAQHHNATVVMLQETWSDDETDFSFPEFTPIAHHRGRHGGGVCTFVHHLFSPEQVYYPTNVQNIMSAHNINSTITLLNTPSTCVGLINIYIPPRSSIPTEDLSLILDEGLMLTAARANITLFSGDVNLRHPHWDSQCNKGSAKANTLYTQLTNHQLVVLNTGAPTCRTVVAKGEGNAESATAIDITAVSTNAYVGHEWVTLPPVGGSPHHVQKLSIPARIEKHLAAARGYKDKILTERSQDGKDARAAWQDCLNRRLKEWYTQPESNAVTPIDELWASLQHIIQSAAEESFKRHKPRLNPQRRWNKHDLYWDQELTTLRRSKSKIWRRWLKHSSAENKEQLKRARALLNYKLKRKQEEWCQALADEAAAQHGRQFYRAAKKVLGYQTNTITSIQHPTTLELVQNQEAAEVFNVHFTTIPQLPTDSSVTAYLTKHAADFDPSIPPPTDLPESFTAPFTPAEMNRQIRCISQNYDKASGLDNISARMVAKGGQALATALLHAHNASWQQGKIAANNKISRVCPVNKTPQPSTNPSDYRGISITNTVAKIDERMVFRRLEEYVERNHKLNSHQFGFREKRSTTDALLLIKHKIIHAIDQNYVVTLISFDLKKAYDTLNRKAIMMRLHQIGIRGNMLWWLCDLLRERAQVTEVNGYRSSTRPSKAGTIQGGPLSQLIFNIVANIILHKSGRPLTDESTKDMEMLYADDLTSLCIHRELSEEAFRKDFEKINRRIKDISAKLAQVGLSFNPKKCKLIQFARSRARWPSKMKAAASQAPLTVADHAIQEVKTLRILGVWFDQHLKFNYHVSVMCEKASQTTNILRRLCTRIHGITALQGIALYKGLVRPYLEYAAPVWHDLNDGTRCWPAHRIQYQTLQLATRTIKGTASAALEVDTGLQPIRLRLDHLCLRYYAACNARPEELNNPVDQLAHQCMSGEAKIHRHCFFPQATQRWHLLTKHTHGSIPLPRKLMHPLVTSTTNMPTPVKLNSTASSSLSETTQHCPFNPKQQKLKHTNEQVQQWVNDQLERCQQNPNVQLVAFVDGSTDKELLCGATAIKTLKRSPNEQGWSETLSSARHAIVADRCQVELAAIFAAMCECVRQFNHNKRPFECHVFTDSQSAIDCLASDIIADSVSYKLIAKMQKTYTSLARRNVVIITRWIPSHTGVQHHDEVDDAAKQCMTNMHNAIEEGKWESEWKACVRPLGTKQVTFGAAAALMNIVLRAHWNQCWQEERKARNYAAIQGSLPNKKLVRKNWQDALPITFRRAQLRLGVNELQQSLHTRSLVESPFCEWCDGKEVESAQHFLLACSHYNALRAETIGEHKNTTEALQLVFGLTDTLNGNQRNFRITQLDKFIQHSKRFARYNVEKILDVRGEPPRREYLIKWQGYDESENSWITEQHALLDIPEQVHIFHVLNPLPVA